MSTMTEGLRFVEPGYRLTSVDGEEIPIKLGEFLADNEELCGTDRRKRKNPGRPLKGARGVTTTGSRSDG